MTALEIATETGWIDEKEFSTVREAIRYVNSFAENDNSVRVEGYNDGRFYKFEVIDKKTQDIICLYRINPDNEY